MNDISIQMDPGTLKIIILTVTGTLFVVICWRLLLTIIAGLFTGGIVFFIFTALIVIGVEQWGHGINRDILGILTIAAGGIAGLLVTVRVWKMVWKKLHSEKKDTKALHQKTVVMLIGQEAVGKTTLLALMYRKLTENIHSQLVASGDTSIQLQQAFQKLCQIIEQPNFTEPERLLPGTQGIAEYNFTIKQHEFSVYDTAGGLIMTEERNADFQFFKSKIAQATLIINVIDGAALIEGSIFLSDRINSPTRIRDLLLKYKTGQRYFILFVITKCEKWLKQEDDIQKLLNAFEDRQKAVLNMVENNENAAGMFMPVKTLGCVEFSYKEGKSESERLVFHKRTNIAFSQENVDKPLLYALKFSLHEPITDIERNFKIYGNKSLIQ